MFFGLDVPFILNELESKKELREYFKISEVLTADQVYKIFSQQNPENLLKALNRILNHQNRVKRRGKKVEFKLFSSENEEIKYLKDVIREYVGNSLAIICKSKKQASKLYLNLQDFVNVSFLDIKNKELKRGIVISGVSLIKGLEFDKVIVYGANDKNYNTQIDKNYFYIACSRAINELTILSENKFTSFVGEKNEENIK